MDEAAWLLMYARFEMENHARIGFARVIGNKVTSPDDVTRVSTFVAYNTCKEPGGEGKSDPKENRVSVRTERLMTITYNLILLYFKRKSKFIYLSNLSIFPSPSHAAALTLSQFRLARFLRNEYARQVWEGREREREKKEISTKREKVGDGRGRLLALLHKHCGPPLSRRNLNWLDKSSRNKAPLYQKHLPNVITTLNKERRPGGCRGRSVGGGGTVAATSLSSSRWGKSSKFVRSKTVGKFARKSSRYFNFASLVLAFSFPPFIFISTICVPIFDNNLVKEGVRDRRTGWEPTPETAQQFYWNEGI